MVRLAEPVFYSIQGEGVYQGVPMVFIRFSGCNLLVHCRWCDTSYAQDGSKGTEMSVDHVVKEVEKFAPRYRDWICITGGEPLFQLDDLHDLVKKLKKYGYSIEVETNSSIKKPYWWTLVDSWVFDLKCPSSGVCGISLEDWLETRDCDQAKFVVGTTEDLDFARKVIMRHMVDAPTVLVSPVTGVLVNKKEGTIEEYWLKPWLQEVAEFCEELRVRYSLQIHKILFGSKRGT